MKTILITGVGTGIGRGAAIALSRRGHKVIATTHTDEGAESLRQHAKEQNCVLEIFTLDITNETHREKIRNLQLDVLLNVAGTGETGPLAEVPMERLRNVFETNVFGTIAMSQIALDGMIKRKTGTVIVVSSLAGRIPIPFLSPYGMSKFALSGGVAAMRNEVHHVAPNVHVSLIEPGSYHTGFNVRMQEKKYEWLNSESNFFHLIPEMKKEDSRFVLLEEKTTDSIVRQIVKACEAYKPKLRYSAPWYQAWGAQALRIIGW